MGRRRAGRKEAAGPPQDHPWVWLTAELIRSPAWRSLSINARRLIDFLTLEHLSHGGKENGHLLAPYRQLEAFGIGARYVGPAIVEAEARGLIAVRRGARKGVAMTEVSRYRLTFLPTWEKAGNLWSVAIPPGDEWRSYDPEGDGEE